MKTPGRLALPKAAAMMLRPLLNKPFEKALFDGDVERAGKLLAFGANPLRLLEGGWTPLSWATLIGSTRHDSGARLVDLLLAFGADPNAACSSGERPLHVAVRYRAGDLLSPLIKAGADPELTNRRGETPAQMPVDDPQILGGPERADVAQKRKLRHQQAMALLEQAIVESAAAPAQAPSPKRSRL
jgi:hypothetical protein